MTDDRFDDLTRVLGKATTRRGVFKGIVAAALGGVLTRAGRQEAGATRATRACSRLREACGGDSGFTCCPRLACDDDGSCCKPTNETCRQDDDCCADDVCRPSGVGMRCLPPGDVGAACVEDTDCAAGLGCVTGVCSTACAAEGDLCGPETTCCSGLMCDPYTASCVAPVDLCAGAACDTPAECEALPGTCDPTTGLCGYTFAPAGTPCTGGTCDGAGVCMPTDLCVGVICTPNECQTGGSCNSATGQCEYTNATDDTPCSIGTCQSGVCMPTTDLCLGVICMTPPSTCYMPFGTCDQATGACAYTPAPAGAPCPGGTCDGSGVCVPDLCAGVMCFTPPNADCYDMFGTCDTATGACVYTPVTDDTACPGGTCQAGVCVPDLCAGVICAPPDECQATGVCNSATGQCEYAPANEGSSCFGGTGTCVGGVCQPTDLCAGVTCDTPGLCEALPGTCDPTTGTCSYPPVSDGTLCPGGTCQAGLCEPDLCAGVTCTTPGECETSPGTCDPGTGTCSYPLATNGTPCAGGNGVCSDGVCLAT